MNTFRLPKKKKLAHYLKSNDSVYGSFFSRACGARTYSKTQSTHR